MKGERQWRQRLEIWSADQQLAKRIEVDKNLPWMPLGHGRTPAAFVGGGVELEGKSASIKSSSESIQLSKALSLFGLRPTALTGARFRSRAASFSASSARSASLWRDRAAS